MMNCDDLDALCKTHKIDVAMQLNLIDRLCDIFANFDILVTKYEQVCYLNYQVMDCIDYIGCLTESCLDENQSILVKEELDVLRNLKKVLHNIRHYYYYNKQNFQIHPRWFGCTEDRDDCTCSSSTDSSSTECVDCQTRIYFQDCLGLMNRAYTMLKNAVKRYQAMPVDA
jgi:hypothetical protein